MNGNCNCKGLNSGVPAEKPIHIPGRRRCECGWDLVQISTIITNMNWDTTEDGHINDINFTKDDLMQCTNKMCRIIKVV